MKIKLLFLLAICTLFFVACRKDPGVGGNASIQGRIYVEKYNRTFTVLLQQYYASEQDVYIVYGDDYGYSDRTKTDYDGRFAFNYLYPGKYTVYVMSKDSTFKTGDTIGSGEVAVKKEVTIQARKEKEDLGDMLIFDY